MQARVQDIKPYDTPGIADEDLEESDFNTEKKGFLDGTGKLALQSLMVTVTHWIQ